VIVSVCQYVNVCVCGMSTFFLVVCVVPSICLDDGIMLCVWDVCCIGCWCIAGGVCVIFVV